MTSLTDTQVITASGGLVELGYGQITSSVTVTSTSFTTPTTIIPDVTVVCDGSPILVEFYASQTAISSGQSQIVFALWEDGSEKHRYWLLKVNPTGSTGVDYDGVKAEVRLTPSAGSHTYSVKAFSSPANNSVLAGSGTTTQSPAFLRVSKIVQATQWPAVTTGTIICTSSTRPSAPFEGQKIYETDTDRELTYDGGAWVQTVELGAWTSWTPTVTQGSTTFTLSGNASSYTRFGKTITAQFYVVIGSGTGQSGQGIVMTLPVAAKSGGGPVYGPVWVFDANVGGAYDGTAFRYGAGVGFIGDWSGQNLLGVTPALVFTTNDQIRGTVTYEAA